MPLRRNLDELRDDGVAAREGLRRSSLLPRLLRDGLLVDADERLPCLAIEDVRPAGLPHFDDRLPRPATHVHIHQDDGVDCVVVPDVVMHLLKVPAILAGLELDGEHRRRVEVVAGAEGAVVVRRGVAGREVDETEIEIDGRRLPDCRTTVLPRIVVLRPRVVARLAGTGNRVEGPDQTTVFRIVGLEPAARAAIAAGKADENHSIHVEWRRCDRKILLPAFGLDRPRNFACRSIERDELAVEPADEHLLLADRHALVVPAAADRGDVGIELRFVLPEDLAAVERQREHVVGAGADIGDTFMDHWSGEAGVLRRRAGAVEPRTPHTLQLRDVVAGDRKSTRLNSSHSQSSYAV